MKGQNSTGYFHICTNGRMLPWLFQDEYDFIAGVNRIGICHLQTKTKVVSFVLMDNHVHFVLKGTISQCKDFIMLYKQLTGTWIRIKYGIRDFLKQLPTDILLLDTEERLLNTIAYIDRNPIVAGYPYLPTEYPWGSARYTFKDFQNIMNTKPLATLSLRNQRSLLNTRITIPGDWRIDCNGMLYPVSFLDVSVVESYFKTSARYSYFLAKKLEGIVENELELQQKKFISDNETREIVKNILRQKYGKENIRDLDINSRLIIAKTLRHDYGSTLKQISRMVHIEKSALEGFI